MREIEDYNRAGGTAAVAFAGAATMQPVTLPAKIPEDAETSASNRSESRFYSRRNAALLVPKADAETKRALKRTSISNNL